MVNGSINRRWAAVMVPLAVVLAIAWWAWPRGYAPVGSKAYAYAKALYSICNRQDTERLDAIETMIDESIRREEITTQEYRYLNAIVRQARVSDWKGGQHECRKLMEDQVTH